MQFTFVTISAIVSMGLAAPLAHDQHYHVHLESPSEVALPASHNSHEGVFHNVNYLPSDANVKVGPSTERYSNTQKRHRGLLHNKLNRANEEKAELSGSATDATANPFFERYSAVQKRHEGFFHDINVRNDNTKISALPTDRKRDVTAADEHTHYHVHVAGEEVANGAVVNKRGAEAGALTHEQHYHVHVGAAKAVGAESAVETRDAEAKAHEQHYQIHAGEMEAQLQVEGAADAAVAGTTTA